MKLSARNIFTGTVRSVTKGAVNSEISIALKDGPEIVAIITNGSVENLGVSAGKEASAIIKASSIIIGVDLHDVKVSARNVLCGTVSRIIEGPVNAEVNLEVARGFAISTIITLESARRLGLKEGGHACAMFKASSVIVGID